MALLPVTVCPSRFFFKGKNILILLSFYEIKFYGIQAVLILVMAILSVMDLSSGYFFWGKNI